MMPSQGHAVCQEYGERGRDQYSEVQDLGDDYNRWIDRYNAAAEVNDRQAACSAARELQSIAEEMGELAKACRRSFLTATEACRKSSNRAIAEDGYERCQDEYKWAGKQRSWAIDTKWELCD